MRTTAGILCAVVAGLIVEGCSKPAPNTVAAAAATPAPAKLAGGSPSDACPSGLTNQGGKPYTMTVLPNFHVDPSGHRRGTPKQPRAQGQLDTTTALNDGEYAQIEIVLTQSLDWGPSPFNVKPNSPLIFCELKVIGQKLTFNTYRLKGGPTLSTYALGMIVHDPSQATEALNVTIDPVMDNDGFALHNR